MKELFWLRPFGPNRYADETVCEQMFRLEPNELNAAMDTSALLQLGKSFGMAADCIVSGEPSLGEWYARLVIQLQQFAGHRVSLALSLPRQDVHEVHVVWEYEHDEVAEQVRRIAMTLLVEHARGLGWPTELGEPIQDLPAALELLRQLGSTTWFPPDSEELLKAARRRGIPCLKLERTPYKGVRGDFRLRLNSMLKFGFCAHRLVTDGMLCIDRSQHVIGRYHDRMSLLPLAQRYSFLVPPGAARGRQAGSLGQALSCAASIGYPVVVKPRRRSHGRGVTTAIGDAGALASAVAAAQVMGPAILVEGHVPGDTYRVLVANHRVVGVFDETGADRRTALEPQFIALAETVSRDERVGLLEMTLVTPQPGAELAEGVVVVDVDHAPRLDRFLLPGSVHMRRAVDGFLDWLYPEGAPTGVPLVAITGTNGKTTTCRMVARMFTEAGRVTALACSDGATVFRRDEVESWEDDTANRYRQLVEPEIEAVVQECHFGLIARQGFPWHQCDVGVVTNVTPDHIGRLGVESVAEMAQLKSVVAERARVIVLNADDPHCMAMAVRLQGKPMYLVTLTDRVDRIREQAGRRALVIFLQNQEGEEWIVLDDAGTQAPILAVNDIPATFNGTARHNISNAQSAAAAGLAAGLSLDIVSRTLTGFAMSFENTPGRMNIYDNGRFKVIMDYAHNEDGLRQIVNYVLSLPVTGKRTIIFTVTDDRQEAQVDAMMHVIAGVYDRYIVRQPRFREDASLADVPGLCKEYLVRYGVPEANIMIIPDQLQALAHAMETAADGDLIVVEPSSTMISRMWSVITGQASHEGGSEHSRDGGFET